MAAPAGAKRREPAVISAALITTALEEEANEHPVESSVQKPAVNPSQALSLRLSFKSALVEMDAGAMQPRV